MCASPDRRICTDGGCGNRYVPSDHVRGQWPVHRHTAVHGHPGGEDERTEHGEIQDRDTVVSDGAEVCGR